MATLRELGCSLKIVTGDNRLVARHVAERVGLVDVDFLTGEDLHRMKDTALSHRVNTVELFAEVEPNQKERIILALKRSNRVVGYMGDGINDAPALHTAVVGISVNSAVDVAKEAADIVLLEKDLGVLEAGVREGRAAFANILKYVNITTSSASPQEARRREDAITKLNSAGGRFERTMWRTNNASQSEGTQGLGLA